MTLFTLAPAVQVRDRTRAAMRVRAACSSACSHRRRSSTCTARSVRACCAAAASPRRWSTRAARRRSRRHDLRRHQALTVTTTGSCKLQSSTLSALAFAADLTCYDTATVNGCAFSDNAQSLLATLVHLATRFVRNGSANSCQPCAAMSRSAESARAAAIASANARRADRSRTTTTCERDRSTRSSTSSGELGVQPKTAQRGGLAASRRGVTIQAAASCGARAAQARTLEAGVCQTASWSARSVRGTSKHGCGARCDST